MQPKQVKKAFVEFLEAHGLALKALLLSEGILSMLSFYKSVSIEQLSDDRDADMLLFQWGTYDWGNGLHFEVDITRQIMLANSDDPEPWQLSLTFLFSPSEASKRLPHGNKWCHSQQELSQFRTFIHESSVYNEFANVNSNEVSLDYSSVE